MLYTIWLLSNVWLLYHPYLSLLYVVCFLFPMVRAIMKSNCYHEKGHDAPCEYGDRLFMLLFGGVQVVFSQIPDFHNMALLCCHHVLRLYLHWLGSRFGQSSRYLLVFVEVPGYDVFLKFYFRTRSSRGVTMFLCYLVYNHHQYMPCLQITRL